jgi:putative ABC transport system ATP-binding protein
MSEAAVVTVRSISKYFGEGLTRVDALREVSLDVYPGTVVGLRGPSGRWLRSDSRRLRLEKIGFIFQAHNLLPFLNAWENIAVAPILAGATLVQAKERALELLTYLGVERRRDAMPGQLSAARRSALRSPALSPTIRVLFWPMSRPLPSIRSAPASSWTSCGKSLPSTGPR